MNTRLASRGMMSKFQRMLLVVLVVIALFGSLPVRKAHAWVYANSSGRLGSVYLPTIYFADLPVGTSNLTVYSNTGPVVYRSPATTGTQTIVALYTVQIKNGANWVNLTQLGPYVGQISANQQYYVFQPVYTRPAFISGNFRFRWSFVWSTSTVTIGATNVESNVAADYQCLMRRCLAYPGYVQVR